MAIQFRCESLSSRFQNPGDEAYSERKLQVRVDPLLGTSSRIAEGVKLQTSVEAALLSFRAPNMIAKSRLKLTAVDSRSTNIMEPQVLQQTGSVVAGACDQDFRARCLTPCRD
jgi:hypothetical protein